MSYIIAGRLNELPPHVQTDLGAYRYDVFVRRLGWTIAGRAHDGHAEWDEFDGPSTIHVVALDDAREVCGYARLLPTTGPYLLRDVFPHLLGSSPAPQSPAVWEMSRFAASRRRRRATEREPLGMDFFPSVLTVAASLGATRVVGVMTLSIERLYRRSASRCIASAARCRPRAAACPRARSSCRASRSRRWAASSAHRVCRCIERQRMRVGRDARVVIFADGVCRCRRVHRLTSHGASRRHASPNWAMSSKRVFGAPRRPCRMARRHGCGPPRPARPESQSAFESLRLDSVPILNLRFQPIHPPM